MKPIKSLKVSHVIRRRAYKSLRALGVSKQEALKSINQWRKDVMVAVRRAEVTLWPNH